MVFRALVLGLTGGLAGGAAMLLGHVIRSSSRGGLEALLFFLTIGAVWCGLLAFCEPFVRPLHPGLRPVALALAGALATLAIGCCGTAVDELLRSGSSVQAWLKVLKQLEDMVWGSDNAELLLIGLGTLAPFAGLGAARIGFVRRGATHPLLCVGVALACGAASTVLFSGLSSAILSLWGFVTFAGGAGAAAAGMALGEPFERWLLKVLRRSTTP